MKYLLLSAIIATNFIITPSQVSAGPCDNLSTAQCRERIADVDRAIVWLESKQQENASEADAAFQSCKASTPAGSDISAVLNCMLNILGP